MSEKITYLELIEKLCDRTGEKREVCEAFVREYFDVVVASLAKDEVVKLKDIGTFKLKNVEERKSVNVQNGSEIIIPAHAKVCFTPEKKLSSDVNKPYSHLQTYILEESAPIETLEPFADDEEENDLSDVDAGINLAQESSIDEVATETVQETDEKLSNSDKKEDQKSSNSRFVIDNGEKYEDEPIFASRLEGNNTSSDLNSDGLKISENLADLAFLANSINNMESSDGQYSTASSDSSDKIVEETLIQTDVVDDKLSVGDDINSENNLIKEDCDNGGSESEKNIENNSEDFEENNCSIIENNLEKGIDENLQEKNEIDVEAENEGKIDADSLENVEQSVEGVKSCAENSVEERNIEDDKSCKISAQTGGDSKILRALIFLLILSIFALIGYMYFDDIKKFIGISNNPQIEQQVEDTKVEITLSESSAISNENNDEDVNVNDMSDNSFDESQPLEQMESDVDISSEQVIEQSYNESNVVEDEKPVKEISSYKFDSELIKFMNKKYPNVDLSIQGIKEEVALAQKQRLVDVALKYYNHKYYWVYLYYFNRDVIKNPNIVAPGTKIKIPELSKSLVDVGNQSTLDVAYDVKVSLIENRK